MKIFKNVLGVSFSPNTLFLLFICFASMIYLPAVPRKTAGVRPPNSNYPAGNYMNINDFREMISQVIESAIEILKEDALYIKHQHLFDNAFAEKNIDYLLSAQMTLHNMELEAVYHAGHCDCLQYLSHVGAIKNE